MIAIKDLRKTYRGQEVLNIPAYNFQSGLCYLLVAENGAGKTTLFKCILKIATYKGSIECGSSKIGYIPEKMYFPEFGTVGFFLTKLTELYNGMNDKIASYCRLFDLDMKKKLHKLSKGMMQKTVIIQALLSNADIYLFDEPLSGLDKKAREIFLKMVSFLIKENKTIIIATHYPFFYKGIPFKKVNLKEGMICDSSL